MILVDTSVWIDHLHGRAAAEPLFALLDLDEVLVHPFVFGELAVGNLGRARGKFLEALALLPKAPVVHEAEVKETVEARRLWGKGIGWIDAHLLASALVSGTGLWTRDGKLAHAAEAMGIRALSR